MKKFILIMLALIMCLSLCACADSSSDPEDTSHINTTDASQTENDTLDEETAPATIFKISSAKIKGSGEALPYYSENAVSLQLPEGMERIYSEATSRQIVFSDGEKEITVRNYYLVAENFILDSSTVAYGEIINAEDKYIIAKTDDNSYMGYVRLAEDEIIELQLSSVSENEAKDIIKSARLCPDNIAELDLTDYMNTLVLWFHQPYEAGNSLYGIDITQLVCSQLWQSKNMIPMEISEDNMSLTVKENDLDALAKQLFGENAKLSASRPQGVFLDRETETYTVALSEASVYGSFSEAYYIKDGKMTVTETEDGLEVKVTLDHSTVSLGNTQTVTLVYYFEKATENGFTYLTLISIKNA